jgi:NAD(P)-dependent dehydrogenase (short-subunit alcohol dehydrogenase family)
MLLERKTAIITGAASPRGIGKATAQLFAEHGARLAIVDVPAADPQRAAADLGPEHRGYTCDVRDKAGCETTARQVIADFGQADILVNNAAISAQTGSWRSRPPTTTRSWTSICVARCTCHRR